MQSIGFKNLISFDERRKLITKEGITFKRFPATGIDNMLLINFEGINILNYNDCNIPSLGRKLLRNEIEILIFL